MTTEGKSEQSAHCNASAAILSDKATFDAHLTNPRFCSHGGPEFFFGTAKIRTCSRSCHPPLYSLSCDVGNLSPSSVLAELSPDNFPGGR